MSALVLQLGLWIGLAAVLGLVAGFCFGLMVPRRSRIAAAEAAHHADVKALRALLDQAREETHHKEEMLALVRAEVESLRAQQQMAAGHVAVVDELRALTRSLQERLDESNERVQKLEQERAARAEFETSRAHEPVNAPVFETQTSISLDVQKSQPLTVERFESEFATVAITTDPHEETPEPVAGAERSIHDLPGMPSAVKERLALIGASTNITFLQKAGRRVGRRALVASTRLDEATLLSWLRLADLMRVGMRTEDLRALWQTGLRGLDELGAADPAKLTARVQAKSTAHGGDAADEATVRRWIERARALQSMVEA